MPSLNEVQLRTLTAAVDRMVPQDDYPSASAAGCIDFLLRLIELEHLAEMYRAGLDGLESEARRGGSSFADLGEAAQDELLRKCEKLKTRITWRVSPKQFVSLLARQTIEGYYSDPGNGGNRDGIAWRMVGFEVRG